MVPISFLFLKAWFCFDLWSPFFAYLCWFHRFCLHFVLGLCDLRCQHICIRDIVCTDNALRWFIHAQVTLEKFIHFPRNDSVWEKRKQHENKASTVSICTRRKRKQNGDFWVKTEGMGTSKPSFSEFIWSSHSDKAQEVSIWSIGLDQRPPGNSI